MSNKPLIVTNDHEKALIARYRMIAEHGWGNFEVKVQDGRWLSLMGGETYKEQDIPKLISLLHHS